MKVRHLWVNQRWLALSLCALFLILGLYPVHAQDAQLAAIMEVVAPGVEVRRVGTASWLAVNLEAIVGVGDEIRTDASGRARIIFFADGTDTELLPNTSYRIEEFAGEASAYRLTVSVLAGNTLQRINRLADTQADYNVNTPGMEMVARGTVFAIRVEDDGRSAMLVSEGGVEALKDAEAEQVPLGFGVRAAVDEELSDVVAATTFDQLDAALDGCAVRLQFAGDIRLNVRTAPRLEADRVGTIDPSEIDNFIGVNAANEWYRLAFREGFGWVQIGSNLRVLEGCAGFRVFPDEHGPEDISLYTYLGDQIEITPTPEAAPESSEDEASEEAESEETDE